MIGLLSEAPARTCRGPRSTFPQSKPPRNIGVRRSRLDRIRVYVDTTFDDPELSPRAAARALGLSVRALHLAMLPAGETFCELVQRRRLGACRQLLANPDHAESITGIAFACGFNSLSSFYRARRKATQAGLVEPSGIEPLTS